MLVSPFESFLFLFFISLEPCKELFPHWSACSPYTALRGTRFVFWKVPSTAQMSRCTTLALHSVLEQPTHFSVSQVCLCESFSHSPTRWHYFYISANSRPIFSAGFYQYANWFSSRRMAWLPDSRNQFKMHLTLVGLTRQTRPRLLNVL